jgi:hypothetical protein
MHRYALLCIPLNGLCSSRGSCLVCLVDGQEMTENNIISIKIESAN